MNFYRSDKLISLGVNIDHIATLRNARGDFFPSLAVAAGIVEQNGGDSITIHLREDRRHIVDDDLFLLKKTVTTFLNLEMACNEDVLKQALKAKPYKATLVPERREEVTTEGGLDVRNNLGRTKEYVTALKSAGIKVSLFIEANIGDVEMYSKTGADEVEIHTGRYSLADIAEKEEILKGLGTFSKASAEAGLKVCAGHGLTYHNVQQICRLGLIEELNIGYSIITRALFSGLGMAVRDMKDLITSASRG
jgi:pyridoxine 5-phosphate synthase